MQIRELNDHELMEASGGWGATIVTLGVIGSVIAIVDAAEQIIEGYNDHRKEN